MVGKTHLLLNVMETYKGNELFFFYTFFTQVKDGFRGAEISMMLGNGYLASHKFPGPSKFPRLVATDKYLLNT